MSDVGRQTVLRCELCDKPFDKHSTLKRHGYYCRSRKNNSRTIRLRSCVACAKAKARCDNGKLRCTRCVAKHLECQYPSGDTVMGSTSVQEHRDAMRDVKQDNSKILPPSNPQSAGIDTRAITGNEHTTPNADLISLNEYDCHWDTLDSGFLGSTNFREQHTPLSAESALPPLYNESQPPAVYEGQLTQMLSLQSLSIPRMPSYQLRSFIQNPAIKGGSQTTAMLMMRILTSYPMMMQNQESLPPFIHSYLLSDLSVSESKSFESLTTCVSLIQMISTKTPGTMKLLWKNVRMECERLQEEWTRLDNWGLLSSIQALMIYILLRLQEGETSNNNLDVPLLATLTIMACALNDRTAGIGCYAPFGLSYGTSHKDWIFEESRRRLVLTFKTLKILLTLEPTNECGLQDDFLLAPLPARKQLWEARDEMSWMGENYRDAVGSGVFGVKANGDMVRLDERRTLLDSEASPVPQGKSTESSANWQEWCAGMDGLGALVMLAASLQMP